MEGIIWIFVFLALLFVPAWLFYIIFICAVFFVFLIGGAFGRGAGIQFAAIMIFFGVIVWFIRFGIHHLAWYW